MGQVRAQEHSERARQAQNSPESRAWTEHGQSRTPPCRYHTCRMPSTVAMAPPYTRTPGTSRKLGAPGKKASSREDWQPAGQQAAKGGPIADDWALQLLAGRGCAADCTSHQLTPEVILLQDCVGAEHSAAPLGDQRCVLVLLGTVLPLLGLACRAEGSAGDAQQGDAQHVSTYSTRHSADDLASISSASLAPNAPPPCDLLAASASGDLFSPSAAAGLYRSRRSRIERSSLQNGSGCRVTSSR